MYISSLSLANFRNYTSEKIEFSPYTNVIYGDNAQGKTNILEAVYIFSQGRSHRAKSDKELIKFGEDFSRLSLDFHDSERDYTAAMQLMKNGRKNIKINHVQITKLSKLSQRCNVFTRRFGACQRFAVRKTKVYRFIGKSALSAIPYKPNRLSQGVGSKKQLTQSSSCKRCKVGYDAFRME